MPHASLPTTLAELQASGWRSRSVKDEVRDNFIRLLQSGQELFPGIVGYDRRDVGPDKIQPAGFEGTDIDHRVEFTSPVGDRQASFLGLDFGPLAAMGKPDHGCHDHGALVHEPHRFGHVAGPDTQAAHAPSDAHPGM